MGRERWTPLLYSHWIGHCKFDNGFSVNRFIAKFRLEMKWTWFYRRVFWDEHIGFKPARGNLVLLVVLSSGVEKNVLFFATVFQGNELVFHLEQATPADWLPT